MRFKSTSFFFKPCLSIIRHSSAFLQKKITLDQLFSILWYVFTMVDVENFFLNENARPGSFLHARSALKQHTSLCVCVCLCVRTHVSENSPVTHVACGLVMSGKGFWPSAQGSASFMEELRLIFSKRFYSLA